MAQYTFIPHINLIAYDKKTAEVERRILQRTGVAHFNHDDNEEVQQEKKKEIRFYNFGKSLFVPKIVFEMEEKSFFMFSTDKSPILRVRKLRLCRNRNECTAQQRKQNFFVCLENHSCYLP